MTENPAPSIYKLIYVSAAITPLDDATLQEILKKSRVNNQRAGITGLLLYCDGSIIQLLEGEKAAVEALYQKILHDPRHHHAIRLLAEKTTARDFPEWSMGFNRVNKELLRDDPHFLEAIEQRTLGSLKLEHLSRRARLLLESFAQTHRLRR